jgi:hypothetical protein
VAVVLWLQTQGPALMTQPFGLEDKSNSYGHHKRILSIKTAQCYMGKCHMLKSMYIINLHWPPIYR